MSVHAVIKGKMPCNHINAIYLRWLSSETHFFPFLLQTVILNFLFEAVNIPWKPSYLINVQFPLLFRGLGGLFLISC